jgi:APA family basic amino acid/polyamine antiporter
MAIESNEGLERVIGVPSLAAITVNNTIGAGIYVLPAAISLQLGAAGVLGYIFCAAMLVTIILCYMEIGSKITTSGGSYVYVEKVFGPFAGFIVNWLFFFGWGVLGSAALMNALADSLAVLVPEFTNGWLRALLFFVLLGTMVLINVRGAKGSVKILEAITIIKLLPLFGIILFACTHIKPANLHWEHLPSIKTFGGAVLILFFAFAGFETSLNVSGEIKDPKRTITRGIALGGGVVFIVYILLQTITQGVLGGQMGKFQSAPLAAVAQNIVGPIGASILIVAAIVSILGNISGDILATPRLLFAGAKDGLFPKFIGKVHPKFATPYYAIIVYAGMIFIFSVTDGFEELAVLASGSLLLIYLGVILAMIKLRRTKEPEGEQGFKVPGGLVIPLIAIATIVWMLTNLKRNEAIATAIFLAVICVIYFAMRFFKGRPQPNDAADAV